MVNYISQQIYITTPATVHCSGGKGSSGTSLDIIIKKENGMTADKAISRLSRIRGESVQSKDQEKILFTYEKYVKK